MPPSQPWAAAGAGPAPDLLAATRLRHAGWAVLLLFLLVTVGPFLLQGGNSETTLTTGSGDVLRQLLYVAALAYVLVSQGALFELGKLGVLPLSLVLLLGWCVLSVGWAIDPAIAFRRVTLTLIVVLAVFVAVEGAGTERTLAMLRAGAVLVLALNYLTVFASPAGVHTTADFDPSLAGDWRGLMLHKNTAGVLSAFTALIWLFTGKRGVLRWLVILAAIVFLYFSGSRTSQGAFAVALLFGLIFRTLSARPRLVVAGLAAIVVLFALFAGQQYLGELSRYLSQPDALTGRLEIWSILLRYAEANLALGAGYGSFWDIGPASPVYQYADDWVLFITSGHSGYLDVLVQLGLGGLLLTVLAVIVLPFWTLLTSDRFPRSTAAFLAGWVTFCATHNVTESSFLDRDRVTWVLLAVAIALIGAGRRAQAAASADPAAPRMAPHA